MSSGKKVVIGLGAIWGLFSLGILIVTSFTIGANDTTPEIVGIVIYGFTVLPACLLAIRFPKTSAYWLVLVSLLTSFGFGYQDFKGVRPADESFGSFVRGLIASQAVAFIPALVGGFLLLLERRSPRQVSP